MKYKKTKSRTKIEEIRRRVITQKAEAEHETYLQKLKEERLFGIPVVAFWRQDNITGELTPVMGMKRKEPWGIVIDVRENRYER